MRAQFLTAALLASVTAAATAMAGPSSAVFANADGSIAGNVVLSVTTAGGTTLIGDSASGNYDQTGAHDPMNPYYLAGLCGSSDACMGNDLVSRDFFSFDLSMLPGKVTGATLMVYNPDATVLPFSGLPVAPGYISAAPSLSYTLYDVATASADVQSATMSRAIYNDLGTGPVLGSTVLTPASDGTVVDIGLDARALRDINAGGVFTLGGAAGAAVPEPVTLGAIGLALAALAKVRLRRAAPSRVA